MGLSIEEKTRAQILAELEKANGGKVSLEEFKLAEGTATEEDIARLSEGNSDSHKYNRRRKTEISPEVATVIAEGKKNTKNKTDVGVSIEGEPEEPTEPTYSQAYQDYLKYMDAYNESMSDYLSGEKFSDAETKRDEYYKLAQDYMDKYVNRDSFSYDVNTDKMYAMYRDQYLKQAQQAGRDAQAQAAALTGGYGSTYASAMGQRAYSAEMDKLDAKASELYENAYNRYQQEGQNMLDAANLYQSQADRLNEQMLTDAQLQYTLGQQKYQESDEYKQAVEDEEAESSWKESYEKGRAELAELKNINRIGNGRDEWFGARTMKGKGGIDAEEFKERLQAVWDKKSDETEEDISKEIIEGLKTFEYDNGKTLSDEAILAYIYDTFGIQI